VGHTYDLFITTHAPGFLMIESVQRLKASYCFVRMKAIWRWTFG
jgi:hypothetical protein